MTDTEAALPAVVVHSPGGLVGRQSPAALAEQANEIREVMRAVLVEGTDYGTIPGVQRPSLFKSGAEWLLKWGGFGHRLEPVETERDEHGRKFGVTYRCTVVLLHDPAAVVSTCDGYAGYDEDRFFQTVEQLEAKERAMASKYQRPAKPEKWAQEHRAPWNSVLKMAEKRALVGATLQACAASGLFTQDVEDIVPGAAAPAPAAPDWFVSNGWDQGEAEHDAHRERLLGRLRSLPSEQFPVFRHWRENVAQIPMDRAWTYAEWEALSGGVDRLERGEPVEQDAQRPADAQKAPDAPPDPPDPEKPAAPEGAPAERQPAPPADDSNHEPCPVCLAPTGRIDPECWACDGAGTLEPHAHEAAAKMADALPELGEDADHVCSLCGSTRTKLVVAAGGIVRCQNASDCKKRQEQKLAEQ